MAAVSGSSFSPHLKRIKPDYFRNMNKKTYHPLSVLLHWLMFLLFVVALAVIEYRDDVPKGDPLRAILRTVHMHAGQLVLLFVLVRVFARWRYAAPAHIDGPRWQTLGASAMHLLLYCIMFALPVSGILFTQAGGRDVVFFGWTLPQLIAVNQDWHDSIRDVHEFMGNAVYYLVGIHVAGALWHQFVNKDAILRRMTWRKQD